MAAESEKILLDSQMLIDSLCVSNEKFAIGYSTKTLRKKYSDVLSLEHKMNNAPKRLIRNMYEKMSMNDFDKNTRGELVKNKKYYALWLLNYVTADDRNISDEDLRRSHFDILAQLFNSENVLDKKHDVTLKNGKKVKRDNVLTHMYNKTIKVYGEDVVIDELRRRGLEFEN